MLRIKSIKMFEDDDTLLDQLNDTIFYRWVKRPYEKIKKLCKWIPLILKDEDWDFEYTLDILELKLNFIKEKLIKDGIVAEEELQEMVKNIDKVLEHIYNYKNYDEIFEKNNKLPFEIDYKFVPTEDHKGSYMITVNKATMEPLTDEEEEQHRTYLTKQIQYGEDQWNVIWDTLKEHGREFWD